jgi:hypothetical protein
MPAAGALFIGVAAGCDLLIFSPIGARSVKSDSRMQTTHSCDFFWNAVLGSLSKPELKRNRKNQSH